MKDSLEEIDRYLNNQMSKEEIDNFEKKVQEDQDFAEQLKLQQDMFLLYNDEDWGQGNSKILKSEKAKELTSFYNSKEAGAIKDTIHSVLEENRSKPNKKFQYLSIAAAIAILFSVSTFMFKDSSSSNDLYAAYINTESIPSLINRGEANDDSLEKAQVLFEEKSYSKAVKVIIDYQKSTQAINPLSYIYLGVSYIEIAQYDLALSQFEKLANSDTLQSKKADWYTSLVYLKKDDKKASREILQKIVVNKNNFKYKEAKELLEKL